MSELRQARTRPLDGFENAGLETLGRGEDLFVKTIGEQPAYSGRLSEAPNSASTATAAAAAICWVRFPMFYAERAKQLPNASRLWHWRVILRSR